MRLSVFLCFVRHCGSRYCVSMPCHTPNLKNEVLNRKLGGGRHFHFLLENANLMKIGVWIRHHEKIHFIETEIKKKVGNSLSTALEAKECLPGWDPRNRAQAQMPGTVGRPGAGCAPPFFFLQKPFRSGVGVQTRIPYVA